MTALKNMLNESVRDNNVRQNNARENNARENNVREIQSDRPQVNVTSMSNTESKKSVLDFETSSAEKIERAFSPPQESNDSWNGF